MSSIFHNLKDKPEDVKNRAALFIAISLTLVIVGIWLLVIKNKNTDADVNEKSIGQEIKPLMMIFGKAGTEFKGIKENINSTKKEN